MAQTRNWIRPESGSIGLPYFEAYRNTFEVRERRTLELVWSADERALLFCDGKRIADGPHRGTARTWFTMKSRIELEPGTHTLVFLLVVMGNHFTAYGQMSVQPGIYVEPDPLLAPEWEAQCCKGCSFAKSYTDWGSFAHLLTDEHFNWDVLYGRGGTWQGVVRIPDSRDLQPSTLPDMRCEETFDYDRKGNYFLFRDYVKVYGEYEFSGTGAVRLRWAEPWTEPEKLDEKFIRGYKPGEPQPYFSGTGDQIILTGKRIRYMDYWWHAGRTLEITLIGDAKLESARFFRTGYPWKLTRSLEVPGDERMTRLLRKSWTTLDACSGETFMDCPYYEQLQYISDSRFDMLSLYELVTDFRLIEKALRQFAEGLSEKGFLSCRYPSKDFAEYEPAFGELCRLHIPAFTAFFTQMVHDFARRRIHDDLVRELLPVLRKSMDYLLACRTEEGLLHVPGWNFIDWRSDWKAGVPPGCMEGTGCTLNLIVRLSLLDLSDMERHFGTEENAAHYMQLAETLAAAVRKKYFRPERGIFAENDAGDYFCEHAQVFALLALGETCVIQELEKGDLPESGIAFGFYYLEACRKFGRQDLFRKRLEKYLATADVPELATMPEVFPGSWWCRSDCHAWSAHILYHYFTQGSILDRIP